MIEDHWIYTEDEYISWDDPDCDGYFHVNQMPGSSIYTAKVQKHTKKT